ncbi:MAG: 3',5'-cyclic-AMP phosphodiesterase, partial [Escherichia coli]|nr:3',5'-cyclic-AMP phosphodiesterase [Escherichia coli]
MESLLTLPLAGEARVRILQITDTHLFAQKHEALLGVNTWESYQAVLEAIRPHQHDFQPAMYSALQDAGISPAKRVFIGEQWQILLLDSQVFGVPHGELSEFQLEWLERK